MQKKLLKCVLKQLGRYASLNDNMYIAANPIFVDYAAYADETQYVGYSANHDNPHTFLND